jgi:hypothetical protein
MYKLEWFNSVLVAMLPYSYDCVNIEVVMESGRVLIDLAACGRWF